MAAPAHRPLHGRVAVVAGATRGAGRGIARALGEAGATVVCTGRSVAGQPSPYKRPETIEQTAEMVVAEGGTAVAVRVDHTVESEVEALFASVQRDHGRLDVVVDSVAGEDPLMKEWGSFWEADLSTADAILRQSLVSHFITAKHAARVMIPAGRGLLVQVTENDMLGGGGNPAAWAVKASIKSFALFAAAELRAHGVASVAITPGFLRSESMLDHFRVSEANWRDAGTQDSNFLESESPIYVGRAVAALAADPRVLERTGQLLSSWGLAEEYGFTDYDGRRPDWGRHAIDWSVLPPPMVEVFRTGTAIEQRWLETLLRRTQAFLAKIPPAGTSV